MDSLTEPGQCQICGRQSDLIPAILSVCVDCIRRRPGESLPPIRRAHGQIRREFDLPPVEPHLPDVISAIEAASKPWVAAIHGTALGGGLEVALDRRAIAAAQAEEVARRAAADPVHKEMALLEAMEAGQL